MKKDISDKKALGYLEMVEQTNIRMENIVNDLSSVVLIKEKMQIDERINLRGMIDATVNIFEFLPGVDKIRFEVAADNDLQIFSDRNLLSTICQNLIGNAIKYRIRDEGHFVSIRAIMKNKGVLLTISDNGEGIPAESKEKIFEMFFRGNLKSTGTGLGLYIVKKAVEKLGGAIQVKSVPGEKTTFTVFLPGTHQKPDGV